MAAIDDLLKTMTQTQRDVIEGAMEKVGSKGAAELKAAKDEGDRLWGALNRSMITSAAEAAIAKHGGSAALLLPHVLGRAKVDRATLSVTVSNAGGQADWTVRDKTVVPSTIEDLVLKLKADKEFSPAFDNAPIPKATGSRVYTPPQGAQPIALGEANPWDKDSANLTRQSFLLKTDPGRAAILRQQAQVAGRMARVDAFSLAGR